MHQARQARESELTKCFPPDCKLLAFEDFEGGPLATSSTWKVGITVPTVTWPSNGNMYMHRSIKQNPDTNRLISIQDQWLLDPTCVV